MRYLTTVSAMACVAVLTIPSPLTAAGDHAHNPANTISTDVGHPDSFRHFAPELPAMQARIPEANTEFGLHVSEIEPGLFFITDFIYQSAFLVTDEGVVVFDAPPSFGDRHRAVIEMSAPGVPITHFILSHKHADHNGGGYAWANLSGPPALLIIAAAAVYLVGCFGVTVVFNVPMNEALARMELSSDATRAYWLQTYVPRWTFWNTVRTVASTTSAALLLFGLLWLTQSQAQQA